MRQHTISVRVSEKEFISIKDTAFDEERSIGSWCKRILLNKIATKKTNKGSK